MLRQVRVTWTNEGSQPIGSVWADITASDAAGRRLDCSATNQCIFTHEDNRGTPIKPGESYTDPDGLGFILIPIAGEIEDVADVSVAVTSVRPPEPLF